MIVFEQFRKSYGKTEIIGIPDLTLTPGNYWLRGENGSGKSTLMKSVAGLIPYKGNVSVNGINIRDKRVAYTSIVNYAAAEPSYPGYLTGNDLIGFYNKAKKAPDGQAEKLCDQLGVNTFSGNRIASYSSGMTKKLSLVLNFLGRPKLILLDEPLITLDITSTGILLQMISESSANGVSFIISSHQEMPPDSLHMENLSIKNKTLERL